MHQNDRVIGDVVMNVLRDATIPSRAQSRRIRSIARWHRMDRNTHLFQSFSAALVQGGWKHQVRFRGGADVVVSSGDSDACVLACVTGGAASAQQPLYGFTAFPLELTAESEDKVHAIISKHANLFCDPHGSVGLPWAEVIAGAP